MTATRHILRQKELGQFLRSRRERMVPSGDLIARHPRRRTPGLRREEVAQEAGVGVSWYTWLEQGRDIRVSASVLRRIARALRLDREETGHVLRLAGFGVPEEPPTVASTVRPTLQRVLDAMEYIPAYVHNARWDRIAWNDAALALMGDFAGDPPEQRNTVWRTFADPAVRAYSEDWEQVARIVIAEFNASVSQQFDDPWLMAFVDRISDHSPEFRQWWATREIIARKEGETRILHPVAGRLHLERSVFQIPYDPSLSLVMFTPLAVERTPERLCELVDAFRQRHARNEDQ
jgi:transcriptional regulator with XRE-family HTH domain